MSRISPIQGIGLAPTSPWKLSAFFCTGSKGLAPAGTSFRGCNEHTYENGHEMLSRNRIMFDILRLKQLRDAQGDDLFVAFPFEGIISPSMPVKWKNVKLM